MKKLLLYFGLLFVCYKMPAQVKLWDGGAGTSSWTDANNWNFNTVPVPGDSVVLNHSLLSGDYTVVFPNSLVSIKCLNVYPSSPGDSIFVTIPSSNNIAPNLRVTGIGYNALKIGNRGKFNNNANNNGNVILIDDLFNYGLMLDTGGYFYQGSISNDTVLLRKLTANINSTFEFDRPSGGYQNITFPVNSQVGNVTFYNLIFSGKKSGSMAYGGTLANNWNLIINGDLTIKDNASFGVVVGAGGQIRYVRIRGNVNVINTSNTLWFDAAAAASFGWFTVFEGNALQTITGNIAFLDSVIINNPNGIVVNNNFDVKTCVTFPITSTNPLLKLQSGIITTSGTGIVRILLTGVNTIVGHSTASYINGKLRRNVVGTGIYDFPLGTAANYELAKINLSSVTGISNITAQFLTSNLGTIPTALTESSNSYTNLLDAGYWRITPNASLTGGSYSLTLKERGYSTGGAPYYTIVKRIDEFNPWFLQGSYTSFNESAGTISADRSGFSSFSDFAIAHPLISLPIELVSFNVYPSGKDAIIEWQTETEINNHYFTVERSTNAQDFIEIAKVNGAGNSMQLLKYIWIDTEPLSGISYYRLKQTDFDGEYKYSEIRTMNVSIENELFVSPNPSNGKFRINSIPCLSTGKFSLEVYTYSGQKLLEDQIVFENNECSYAVDFSEKLKPGMYLLQISTSSKKYITKLIIQ
jgi:hypothetical protein